MQLCNVCNQIKPDDAFYPYNKTRCKACNTVACQRWQRENKTKKNDNNARWRARNSERITRMKRASNAVMNALKRGLIVRPATCEACARFDRIEAAHTNYDDLLNVRWLCVSCHRTWDSNAPKS
jgi:hypothetical protein